MDPEFANVLQAACYSAAAFGGIYAIARYSFLKRKSDNETHAERTRADMESEKQGVDGIKGLLADPNYQSYLERRKEVGLELVNRNPDSLKWSGEQKKLERTIGAIVGNLMPE